MIIILQNILDIAVMIIEENKPGGKRAEKFRKENSCGYHAYESESEHNGIFALPFPIPAIFLERSHYQVGGHGKNEHPGQLMRQQRENEKRAGCHCEMYVDAEFLPDILYP